MADLEEEVPAEQDKDSAFLNDTSLEIVFGGGDPDVPMQVELSNIEKSIHASEEEPQQEASEQNLENLLRECLAAEDPTPPLEDSQRRVFRFTKPILTRVEAEAYRQREEEINVVRKQKTDASAKPSSKSTQQSSEAENKRRQNVELESAELPESGWNCGVCVTDSQQSGKSVCALF